MLFRSIVSRCLMPFPFPFFTFPLPVFPSLQGEAGNGDGKEKQHIHRRQLKRCSKQSSFSGHAYIPNVFDVICLLTTPFLLPTVYALIISSQFPLHYFMSYYRFPFRNIKNTGNGERELESKNGTRKWKRDAGTWIGKRGTANGEREAGIGEREQKT